MIWEPPLDDADVLSLLMEHFPGLLFVKDEDSRIVAANDHFLALYPAETRASVIGTTTLEDYPEDQREAFLAEDRKALESGESEVVEEIDFPGGQRRTILTRKVGKDGLDGKRYLIGASVDITELEEQRRETAELWRMVNHSASEILILDYDSLDVLRLSTGAEKNLGVDTGQALNFMGCLHPDSAPEFTALHESFFEDPSLRGRFAGRFRRVDGTDYPVEAQVLCGSYRSTPVLLVISRDVSEELESRRVLERQNQALNEFAYRVSHDLRSPVVSSIGLLRVAQEMLAAGQTDAAGRVVERSIQALAQAETLAEDLLNLTRVEQLEPKAQQVRLPDLLDACVARTSALFGPDLVEIELQLGGVEVVNTDRQRLLWILDNLLSNAIKYRDPAKATPRVTLRASREGRMLQLRCEDNGLGIPEQYRERVFSMFQRFHATQEPGSGLGLYMVAATARRLGGGVRYLPQADGSVFVVTVSEDTARWS